MARQKPKAVFFEHVAQMVEQARHFVGRTADLTMCVTYFEIGRMIVEKEQGGKVRAEYGKGLIAELSAYLNERFGRGFSVVNLQNARKFYEIYAPRIGQSMTAQLGNEQPKQIPQAMITELGDDSESQIQQTMSVKLENVPSKRIQQSMTVKSGNSDLVPKSQSLTGFSGKPDMSVKSQSLISKLYPFRLSWTHYVFLTQIKNDQERSFYEIEAANQQWTVRQLQRQYSSSLYERLALSRNKNEVMRLAVEGQTIEKPQDLLKAPFVLEFLGMEEKAEFSESDLESAIISKLQAFLLEIGKGFLFEARQKRFTFDEEHFMVDLVFYNRLLSCYVLIDLKTDKLKHQDLGQMQMYVNYFDRHVKTKAEKPTIGILLCKQKNDSIVELTLPKRSNIYASEYSLYLPDKGLLQRKLTEWAEEFEAERRMKNRMRR